MSHHRKRRIVLMGPPGVGKGTQAARLAARIAVTSISTGDVFREHVRAGTELGQKVKATLASGGYVDDAITNAIVADRLLQPDAASGFILDGYPRTRAQIEALDGMLDSGGIDAVILLDAERDTIVKRLLERAKVLGREDDTPEVITDRIDIYERETGPITAVYEGRGLLQRVDGNGDPEEVSARLAEVLGGSVAAER